jgi:dienelactone hydrolase
MAAQGKTIEYPHGDVTCIGEYFVPEGADTPLPVVLVVHAWDGLGDEVRDKAARLAQAGYITFAVDLYGNGKFYPDMAQLEEAVTPYIADRALLLGRMESAVAAAKAIPNVNPDRIAAMGYCFGGLAVLDLARAGRADVQAAIAFHGALMGNGLDGPNKLPAKILVLHGEDDPLVPPEQVEAFKTEMKSKQVDWQFTSYGNTLHAFTRPDANMPDFGALYSASADRRSWQAMLALLAETYGD